ncbi:hypothetical protein Hamer_G009808 [Homarus americanus]|uniref:Uncharacterized protein n=1 Tax=Homarus americanus TaxID=6706 RepID=A0A8J5N9Z7_HOMAM|nr:hypothetical protein Hamer_G009808 [Homarus americanus]
MCKPSVGVRTARPALPSRCGVLTNNLVLAARPSEVKKPRDVVVPGSVPIAPTLPSCRNEGPL